MVVLDDADPATVAEAVKIGGYWNSGQDCTASSRILVSERIYDDVLSETVSAVESLAVGDPADGEEIEMGRSSRRSSRSGCWASSSARAPPRRRSSPAGARRARLLRQAHGRHGRGPGRGDRAEGGLRARRHRAALRLRRRGDRDGQRRPVRAGRLGVLGEPRPGDEGRGRLDFGTVWINEHLFPLASRCRTAAKESGYGKDMSLYSMEEYTRIKHVAVKLA